jgi:hypothetical protein
VTELCTAPIKTAAICCKEEVNSILASPLRFLRLLDQLVRSRQHVRRDRQPNPLRRRPLQPGSKQ